MGQVGSAVVPAKGLAFFGTNTTGDVQARGTGQLEPKNLKHRERSRESAEVMVHGYEKMVSGWARNR